MYKKINTYIIIKERVLVKRLLLLSRLILKHKFNSKGIVIYKKVRLCIREDKQTPDINYFKTFVFIIQYNIFKFLITKVAAKDLNLDHVNVKTVFLNLTLQKKIYIQISNLLREFLPKLKRIKNIYLKLNKLFYGLKQVLRE
jgi:hypothetical protein